jgi:uncharacterized membrane protein
MKRSLKNLVQPCLILCLCVACLNGQENKVIFTKLTSEPLALKAVADEANRLAGMSLSSFKSVIVDPEGSDTPEAFGKYKNSVINGINPTGEITVGFVSISYDKTAPADAPSQQAFIYKQSGLELLPFAEGLSTPPDIRIKSRAESLSGDGSVVVGCIGLGGRYQAISWVDTKPKVLPFPEPEYVSSVAYDVSIDGSLIVGACSTRKDDTVAVAWTKDGVLILGKGMALDTSSNGEHTVGVIDRNDGKPTAMLYSQGTEILLSSLVGFTGSMPHSVSDTGSVVAGQGLTGASPRATVWLKDSKYEPLDLNEVFGDEIKREGIPTLVSAQHVSSDGLSLVVVGGDRSVYKVNLPENYFATHLNPNSPSANKSE